MRRWNTVIKRVKEHYQKNKDSIKNACIFSLAITSAIVTLAYDATVKSMKANNL